MAGQQTTYIETGAKHERWCHPGTETTVRCPCGQYQIEMPKPEQVVTCPGCKREHARAASSYGCRVFGQR